MSKRAVKTGGVMTEGQVFTALRERYPAREYALLEQVRNGTGYSRITRTADAIALSLWPSRGLMLHGFELKRYRGDWKREKDAPEKAEAIARFCDFWWLVVTDARIVQPGELPPTWGLLAPNEDATRLVVVSEAMKMEPQPWSRAFMAAVLRNAADASVPTSVVEQCVMDAERKGFERGKGLAPATDTERQLKRLAELEERISAFTRASGINLNYVNAKAIGEAAHIVLRQRNAHVQFVENMRRSATCLLESLERPLKNIRAQAIELQTRLNNDAIAFEALGAQPIEQEGEPPATIDKEATGGSQEHAS